MLVNTKKGFSLVASAALIGMSLVAGARPTIGLDGLHRNAGQLRTTAASCKPATSSIDLDINNVRSRLMTGGDMWWDQGTNEARYEVPKGSKKNALFSGSCWIGGFDPQGNLKVAAQTYRQTGNDYWPGPLEAAGSGFATTATTCSEWDKFWKVNKSDILLFRDLVSKGQKPNPNQFEAIYQWPAKGNDKALGNSGLPLTELNNGRDYAPFVDVDHDGYYDADKGDYPDILGDQYIWWVFNDVGNIKLNTQTDGIGMEVQTSAFAFATNDNLNNMTFYNYRMINRSPSTLDTAFIATWTDADLGYAFDDYIGCDTARGLGVLYNGKSIDGNGEPSSYGAQVPMVGVDFFIGPKKFYKDSLGRDTFRKLKMTAFTYFTNGDPVTGDPNNGQQVYGYMTGTAKNGERFSFDWDGVAGSGTKGHGTGPLINYVFTGDPSVKAEWSECTCNNKAGDRRFIHSSGPFQLQAGSARSQNDVTIGAVWVADVGGCPNTSFRKIRVADDQAQELFDNGFKTIEGPEAPRMVIREMDRKLVVYLQNDSISSNFQEGFGTNLSDEKYRSGTPKMKRYADSLYKFEGYRVFQLKNSQVTTAQIFDENGVVNNDVAYEVFQTDIHNGVSRIINYQNVRDISDSTWVPQIKVNGKDSGITHSFALEFDAFAKGADKRFVNYRNYYFVAIAYAYNNFRKFSSVGELADSTQDRPYIESAHGAGGIPIPIVIAMPNPANGDMGTVLNSDYGSGVIIKKLEGIGNGGNFLAMDEASEQDAMDESKNFQSVTPTYVAGSGPVSVKVVDPRLVKPGNWELYITGKANATDATKGIIPDSGSWRLVYNGGEAGTDVVYSERSLSLVNEQILEKYGLSVSIAQSVRPGDDQVNNNGKVGSDMIFEEAGKAWLTGVIDAEQTSAQNWIRSGKNQDTASSVKCSYKDYKLDTVGQFYENLLPSNTLLKGTWAPYALAVAEDGLECGFGVAKIGTAGTTQGMTNLHGVDIVFTSDKSKWTRSVVIELQDDKTLSEGGAKKFEVRKHRSWDGDVAENGSPIYSTTDSGMSWFPGYAIDQETGERLNIVFGEDSWLKSDNGNDMIWNPTTTLMNFSGNVVNGGKHYIYVHRSKYDKCQDIKKTLTNGSTAVVVNKKFTDFMWVGLPLVNQGYQLKSLADGIIPTTTRLRFRVSRPYANYVSDQQLNENLKNGGYPVYSFSTDGLAPTKLGDGSNTDKDAVRDRIQVVPNPYYGYAGYENNRLDTRVRIINLPRKATVSVYSLDGTLVRRLEKDNANVSYIDWDLRNAKSLQVTSGMYLIHVNAEGVGEKIIRWFGAMRPVDITTY